MWDVSTRRPAGGPIPAAVGAGGQVRGLQPGRDGPGQRGRRWVRPALGSNQRHPVGLSLSIGTSALVTDPVLASFSPDGGLIALMHSSGETVAWPEWLVADPHQALCKRVGPPPSYVWSMTAPGEPEPDMCP